MPSFTEAVSGGFSVLVWVVFALHLLQLLLDPWRKELLQRIPDWCVSSFCMVGGLAINWAWAYEWFSRRYGLFSGPVLGQMASLVALSSLIAFLVSVLWGGKWRLGVVFFALSSCVLARLFHG